MRRRPLLLVLTVVIGLVLAACGGSPSESGEPAESSGGQPGASQAAASEPAASEAAGGGGGGGSDDAPVLADGSWNGGKADVEVSGAASASFTAPLVPIASNTSGGSTVLLYVTDEGASLQVVINSGDPFGVAVTTAEFIVGGGEAQGCEVTYRQADDSNIDASFRCDNADAITTTGGVVGNSDLEGTFTASR